MRNSGKVIIDELSVQAVPSNGNCLFRSLSACTSRRTVSTINEGRRLNNKFALYLRAKSFNRQPQLLVKLREKEVYLFYIC
jgi:hypothetical protein